MNWVAGQKSVQLISQFVGRAVPALGVKLQALLGNNRQVAWNFPARGFQGLVPAAGCEQQRFPVRVSLIRRLSGKQRVQDATQPVDIGGRPHGGQSRSKPGLLRCQVACRPQHLARFC